VSRLRVVRPSEPSTLMVGVATAIAAPPSAPERPVDVVREAPVTS
jgi:hypothetical protein